MFKIFMDSAKLSSKRSTDVHSYKQFSPPSLTLDISLLIFTDVHLMSER